MLLILEAEGLDGANWIKKGERRGRDGGRDGGRGGFAETPLQKGFLLKKGRDERFFQFVFARFCAAANDCQRGYGSLPTRIRITANEP